MSSMAPMIALDTSPESLGSLSSHRVSDLTSANLTGLLDVVVECGLIGLETALAKLTLSDPTG